MNANLEEDKKLIKQYLNGSQDSFNELYQKYKRQLYSYLNKMLPGQSSLVDDLFQKTWVKIIANLEKYKCQQKFLAWAMRISHNIAIDHFRKEKNFANAEEFDVDRNDYGNHKNEPWREMADDELRKILAIALGKLSLEQREVFLLRQKGVSFKEIAKIQSGSINTVLARMQYAMKKLKSIVKNKV